mgnify:CR=1 FL=1
MKHVNPVLNKPSPVSVIRRICQQQKLYGSRVIERARMLGHAVGDVLTHHTYRSSAAAATGAKTQHFWLPVTVCRCLPTQTHVEVECETCEHEGAGHSICDMGGGAAHVMQRRRQALRCLSHLFFTTKVMESRVLSDMRSHRFVMHTPAPRACITSPPQPRPPPPPPLCMCQRGHAA